VYAVHLHFGLNSPLITLQLACSRDDLDLSAPAAKLSFLVVASLSRRSISASRLGAPRGAPSVPMLLETFAHLCLS
jgi:hypothetical protein